jgi:uncharacterized membrane protein (UPF0127 family)
VRLRGLRIALVAIVAAVALASCAATSSDRLSVEMGGRSWTLLRAGADGMRGLDDFDGADGMLFDLGRETDPSAVAFVMDGVSIPLDIAWFAASGELVGTAAMEPCPAEPCPRHVAQAPFRWAVEAPTGAFDGLAPGDRLEVAEAVGGD